MIPLLGMIQDSLALVVSRRDSEDRGDEVAPTLGALLRVVDSSDQDVNTSHVPELVVGAGATLGLPRSNGVADQVLTLGVLAGHPEEVLGDLLDFAAVLTVEGEGSLFASPEPFPSRRKEAIQRIAGKRRTLSAL